MSGDWSDDGVTVLGLIIDTGCVASSKIGLPCQAGPREIVLLEHSTTKYALLDLRRVRDDRGKADVRHNNSGGDLQIGRNGIKSKSRCSLLTTISIRWFMQVQMLVSWKHLAVTARVWHANGQDQASSGHKYYHRENTVQVWDEHGMQLCMKW